MGTYFMMGKYSAGALKEISGDRTENAIALIKELGGKVHAMYALLGEYDAILIVDLPDTHSAMKASIGLSVLTGISFSSFPALTVSDLDKMMGG
ncbi:MAG: GYD domain-containing protein [Candidatus Omnitrophota bacterium]